MTRSFRLGVLLADFAALMCIVIAVFGTVLLLAEAVPCGTDLDCEVRHD